MRRSLRLRLIVWILALLVPAAAAAGWLLVQVFANRLLRDIDVALEEEATTAAALLVRPSSADATATLLAHLAGETDLGPGKRIVVRRGGAVIAEAPPGSAAVLASGDPVLRIATATAGSPAAPLTVLVGVPATDAQHATQRLILLLAVGIPAGVLLIGAGLWVVIGRALRPLETAARSMEGIGVGDLAARVPIDNRDDEVGRMVVGLNRMLDRLAHAVGEMQRFTADAAHELRTPLAVLRTGLEVTLAHPRSADEYRAALCDALDESERLTQLAEDLLTLARQESADASRRSETVDVREMVHELVDAWEGQAATRQISLVAETGSALPARGSAADLYRLFGNLLDNALRHSPAAARVAVRAEIADDRIHVSVSDTGPGIAADEIERVFERFYRARAAGGTGSGLGLSIARAVARAHGGDLRLTGGAAGGCVAHVWLPLAT
ncbi:MAG: ATP-binding protein [bacterium]